MHATTRVRLYVLKCELTYCPGRFGWGFFYKERPGVNRALRLAASLRLPTARRFKGKNGRLLIQAWLQILCEPRLVYVRPILSLRDVVTVTPDWSSKGPALSAPGPVQDRTGLQAVAWKFGNE